MYKLIYADEERGGCDKILDHTDWEAEGFHLVGRCDNGDELMNLVERELPDLVILEVNLRFISGLEAARQIRAGFPRTRILFLTDCTDFESARQAVELHALHYLLKPCAPETLKGALRDAKSHLDQQRLNLQNMADLEHYYRQNRNMLLEELLRGMSEGETICKRARALKLPWDGNTWFQAAALSLKAVEGSAWEQGDRQAMVYALYNILLELLENEHLGLACIREGQVIAAGFGQDRAELERRMEALLLNVLDIAENQLQIAVTAGISDFSRDCTRFPSQLSTARQALELQKRFGSGRLYTAQDLGGQDTGCKTVWEAVAYIEQMYQNPELSAAAVSEYLHISPGYLRTLFKRQTGSTIIGFITKVRMEKAKELLLRGDQKNSDIAGQVGYVNPHYFSYCFRRYYGFSPAEAKERFAVSETAD